MWGDFLKLAFERLSFKSVLGVGAASAAVIFLLPKVTDVPEYVDWIAWVLLCFCAPWLIVAMVQPWFLGSGDRAREKERRADALRGSIRTFVPRVGSDERRPDNPHEHNKQTARISDFYHRLKRLGIPTPAYDPHAENIYFEYHWQYLEFIATHLGTSNIKDVRRSAKAYLKAKK